MKCWGLLRDLRETEEGGTIVDLLQKTIIIGRGTDADLIILSRSVSNHHAKLELSDSGAVILTDLNSRNGTFVNEIRVLDTRQRVTGGDVIRFGYDTAMYRFELAGSASSREASPESRRQQQRVSDYEISKREHERPERGGDRRAGKSSSPDRLDLGWAEVKTDHVPIDDQKNTGHERKKIDSTPPGGRVVDSGSPMREREKRDERDNYIEDLERSVADLRRALGELQGQQSPQSKPLETAQRSGFGAGLPFPSDVAPTEAGDMDLQRELEEDLEKKRALLFSSEGGISGEMEESRRVPERQERQTDSPRERHTDPVGESDGGREAELVKTVATLQREIETLRAKLRLSARPESELAKALVTAEENLKNMRGHTCNLQQQLADSKNMLASFIQAANSPNPQDLQRFVDDHANQLLSVRRECSQLMERLQKTNCEWTETRDEHRAMALRIETLESELHRRDEIHATALATKIDAVKTLNDNLAKLSAKGDSVKLDAARFLVEQIYSQEQAMLENSKVLGALEEKISASNLENFELREKLASLLGDGSVEALVDRLRNEIETLKRQGSVTRVLELEDANLRLQLQVSEMGTRSAVKNEK